MTQTTFVLVHGAWHGGWCWRRVADLLTAKGHRVFTPTLTGLGERSHLMQPGINVSTHATDVVNVIKYEANPQDNRQSKVYLSKRLTSDVLRAHTSTRTVVYAD